MMTAQKLRLLLAKIASKSARNLPLTPFEQNLVAECQYRYHMKPQERVTVDADGTVRIHKQVDAEPVMKALHDYRDVLGAKHKGKAATRLHGSIDPITAAIWRKECGAGIGTKEFAEYAKKKLASREFSRFKFGA